MLLSCFAHITGPSLLGEASGSASSLSFLSLLPTSGDPLTSYATLPATCSGTTPTAAHIAPLLSLPTADASLSAMDFSLASSFPPIPAKLTAKIKALQFVEMRELLPDNISASEQHASSSRSPHDLPPRQREVFSILTWVSAFVTYAAIVSEAHPSRTNNKGWISYDRIFQQNAATNPSLSWANLDPSLHSSFCLGNEPPHTVCSLCNELDHKSNECALAKPSHHSEREKFFRQPSSSCHASSRALPSKCPAPRICLSWNSGQCTCMLPGTCEYSHKCHTCHDPDHRAQDCNLTPADLLLKRPKKTKLAPPATK